MTWGSKWRLLAWKNKGQEKVEMHNEGIFDELVIDDWFHIEQMDTDAWWMRIGRYNVNIQLRKDGKHRVRIEEE